MLPVVKVVSVVAKVAVLTSAARNTARELVKSQTIKDKDVGISNLI